MRASFLGSLLGPAAKLPFLKGGLLVPVLSVYFFLSDWGSPCLESVGLSSAHGARLGLVPEKACLSVDLPLCSSDCKGAILLADWDLVLPLICGVLPS